VIEPPRMPIPLDVLSLSQKDQFGIDEAALRFRESFSRLKGSKLGDRQRNYVHEAASRALAKEFCELRHIRDRLSEVYEEHEAKEDGAISSMEELCRFPLFEPKLSPAEFFQKSWIIKLPPTCRKIAGRSSSTCCWTRSISISTALWMPRPAPMARGACASSA
jgi:DNA sulfur modification protein DndE